MGLIKWLMRVTDFPYSVDLADRVAGSPAAFEGFIDALLADGCANQLNLDDANNHTDMIRDHVTVTRSFKSARLRVAINISDDRRGLREAMLQDLLTLLPVDDWLDKQRSDEETLVFNTSLDELSKPALAQLIDEIYRQVYGYDPGYEVSAMLQSAQAWGID